MAMAMSTLCVHYSNCSSLHKQEVEVYLFDLAMNIKLTFVWAIVAVAIAAQENDEEVKPCTLHSTSSSFDSDGNDSSLAESGTMSIGNKVLNIVDEGNTMTIGDVKLRIFG
ncbi:hypothetical protein P3T76_009278 [Phytophthora citrophthora]|uniref:Uncharacterized protein n=1 Tax=Phytophthora citrophthora TaxID=4793 RepID=A0AAD9GGT0_9STRA|nr:hypothetical protein P3T76_009278 [Phytophthora citrophthora]